MNWKRRPRPVKPRTAVAGVALLAALALAATSHPASAGEADGQPDLAGLDLAQLQLSPEPMVAPSAAGNFLAARVAQGGGDWQGAARFMRAVHELDSGNIDVARRSFGLALAGGDIPHAFSLVDQLDSVPGSGDLLVIATALKLLDDGEAGAAINYLDNASLTSFHGYIADMIAAWAAFADGRGDEARALLETITENDQVAGFTAYQLSLMSEADGAMDDALVWGEAAVDGHAGFREMTQFLGLLDRMGRTDEALDRLTRLEAERASDPALIELRRALENGQSLEPLVEEPLDGVGNALFGFAQLVFQDGSNDLARAFAHLSMHMGGAAADGHLLLGDIARREGHHDVALKHYTNARPAGLLDWHVNLRRGEALVRTGWFDEGEVLLNTLSERWPEETEALVVLGDAFRREGDFALALEAYDEAVERMERHGREDWWLLFSRAICYERLDRWDDAEVDLLRALELEPDQPMVLNYLGYSWADQGIRLDDARDKIERALEGMPDDGFIIDSLGWVLFRQGDLDGARFHLERAVSKEPSDPVINDHLGDVYWHKGYRLQARYQWERALIGAKDEGNDDLVAETRRKLDEGLETPEWLIEQGQGADSGTGVPSPVPGSRGDPTMDDI